MEADIAPYRDAGTVETVRANLDGAKYTLATNAKPVPTLGIKDFADIATQKDALDGKIYGIEPGNDGNRLILDMIADGRLRPGRLRAGGKLGTGDAGRRSPSADERRRADRLPRLGTASDERQLQDDLSDRRR